MEAESSPYDLVINGLVDHPRNFTYNKLQKLPRISEVALILCIEDSTEIYNWTGIPIFFLLNMTGVKAGATEVVFYASDGYSSSLTIERALHPTQFWHFKQMEQSSHMITVILTVWLLHANTATNG